MSLRPLTRSSGRLSRKEIKRVTEAFENVRLTLRICDKVCHDSIHMDLRDPESKKAVLAELLEQGMVLITLDARRSDVNVPAPLRHDPQLRLNLSYRFGLPMQLDDEGVQATLTFSGTPYACSIPWSAIYLFVSHVSGRPILFPADVPAEFAHGVLDTTTNNKPVKSSSSRPQLRVVTETVEPTIDAPPQQEEPEPRTPPRRGHLRLVK